MGNKHHIIFSNNFISLPYEQINLKNSNYSQAIECLNYSTNLSIGQDRDDFKNLNLNLDKLKYFLNQQKEEFIAKENELKQKKILMKDELLINLEALKILSSYEK